MRCSRIVKGRIEEATRRHNVIRTRNTHHSATSCASLERPGEQPGEEDGNRDESLKLNERSIPRVLTCAYHHPFEA